MIKGIFTLCLTIFISTYAFCIDQIELQNLTKKGDYKTAYTAVTASSLEETLSAASNDFYLIVAEILFNNNDKVQLKKLVDLYQAKAISDQNAFPSINTIQAYFYASTNDLSKAEEFLLANLTTKMKGSSKAKDRQSFDALFKLANIELELENIVTAEKLSAVVSNKAENIFSKSDKEFNNSLLLAAKVALVKGELDKALSSLEEAGINFSGNKDDYSLSYADFLITQAHVYLKKGEPAVVSSHLKKAEAILSAFVPKSHALNIKHALVYSEFARFMGNYGKGYKRINDLTQDTAVAPLNTFQLKLSLVELYYKAEKFSAGLDILNNLAFPENVSKNGPTGMRYTHLKIKETLLNSSIENAISAYKNLSDSILKYLGIGHPLYVDNQIQLGKLYFKTGQYGSAEKSLKAAVDGIKIFGNANHPYYINIQQELALIYWADGKKVKAQRYFNETSENYIYQYNKVFAILSEKEKNIFYSNIRNFYDKYNAFMLEEYKNKPSLIGAVYNNQLSNKAILFNSAQELKNAVYSGSDTSLIAKLNEWNGLRENLAKAYKLIAEGVQVEQGLIDDLEKKALEMEEYIQLKASLNKSKDGRMKKIINWYDVQSFLQKNEAAIEMVRISGFKPDSGGMQTNDVNYAALVLTRKTKKNPELIVINDGNLLENKQNKYYRNLIRFKMLDSMSYMAYWKPIIQNKKLKDVKTIFISPDGIYNQINLNTLYDNETKQYEIDRHSISILTNTKDIVSMRSVRKKKGRLPENSVLIGYPEYYTSDNPNITVESQKNAKKKTDNTTSSTRSFRGDAINELPGTKIEIETIKGLLTDSIQNHSTESFLAKDANEFNMKRITSPGILHVATHGFFNDPTAMASSESNVLVDVYQDNPLLLCGILLSGAGFAYVDEVLNAELDALASGKNVEDGILTAYEAMNMNLDGLELAILSACETGLGKVQSGEGVYGFQRALQTAGAKAILMSLWKVDDEATKKLMIYFYSYWNETGNKLKAFEMAQKKIKEEFKDPIYWGAFIMVGW